MYVTVLSNTRKSEFPDNKPNSFKVRLAKPLKLKGWQVGLANIYLPGLKHKETHAVTTQPSEKVYQPITELRQHKLYDRTTTKFLFEMYGRGIKKSDNSQTRDVFAKMNIADMPPADTGVVFMSKVVNWLQQKLLDELPVGYCFAIGNKEYIPTFEWQTHNGEETLRIHNSRLVLNYTKPFPYFAVNLSVAQHMGWIAKAGETTYKIGPNVLRHPYENHWTQEKLAPNADPNSMFTFGDYLHVHQGIVYFSMTYDWQFINLNEAYKAAVTHQFDPPETLDNLFAYLMEDTMHWLNITGLQGLDYTQLEISPHIWNKKVLAMYPRKQGNTYKATWEFNMSQVGKGGSNLLMLETYVTDKTLFDNLTIKVSKIGRWMFLRSVYTGNYVHLQDGAVMTYYKKQLIWFGQSQHRNSVPPYKLKFELTINNVPAKYPNMLWDSLYVVTYGYKDDLAPDEHISLTSIKDVYDGHPPGEEELISTSYWVFNPIAEHPANLDDKTKHYSMQPAMKSMKAKVQPAMIYCNVGESRMVGNQITNFLQDVPYKNEAMWWSPETTHYTAVRDETTEVVEVEVADNTGKLLNLNPHGETQLTLHFKQA